MIVEVDVWVYKISKCGYYQSPNARSSTAAEFGKIGDILSSLQSWVTDSSMRNTSTYTCDETDLTATYLLDIKRHTNGDYLLSLWNQVTSFGQNVSYINANAQVGTAVTQKGTGPTDGIPGVASYFWFMPNQGYVSIVKINKSKPKKANFERYIYEFIKSVNPNHIEVENLPDGKISIVGYKKDDEAEPEKLHASFTWDCLENKKNIDLIKANRENIVAIELKSKIRHSQELQKTVIDGIVKKAKIPTADNVHVEVIDLQMDIPFTPSEEELEAVIAAWKAETDKLEGNPDKIGFKFNNSPKVMYLHDALARKKFQLNLESSGDYFDATSIIRNLALIRGEVLEMITS